MSNKWRVKREWPPIIHDSDDPIVGWRWRVRSPEGELYGETLDWREAFEYADKMARSVWVPSASGWRRYYE